MSGWQIGCRLFGVSIVLVASGSVGGQESAAPATGTAVPVKPAGPLYVVPVNDTVERGLAFYIERAIAKAESVSASGIVLQVDTFGGELQATEQIKSALLSCQVETYSYVDRKAISAGAIICVSTRHIYMAPGAEIGAATPVMMSPTGGMAEVGEKYEAKVISATMALMESAAETNGHPTEIVRAMVDGDIELPDVPEKQKGKPITLTTMQAERLRLSEGTFDNIDALIAHLGYSRPQVVRFTLTPAERMARFVTTPTVAGILMLLGIAGLYFEFKTPGFGVFGILGIIFLVLFFWGHYIARLAGMEEVFLFVIGVTLLFIELFITPGFGFMGITGIFLIVISLVLAMIRLPPPEIPITWRTFSLPIYSLSIAATGFLVLFITLVSTAHRLWIWRWIGLATAEKSNEGYSQASVEADALLGKEGTSLSYLRPAGIARIEGRRVDVITQGEFIQPNRPIVVIAVEGNRKVVKEQE